MTIIVYRAGIMAADSAVHAGDRLSGTVRKLVKRSDGSIAGASGPTAVCHAFRGWFVERPAFRVPFDPKCDDFGAIMVYSDGSVWRIDKHGFTFPAPEADYHIEGIGGRNRCRRFGAWGDGG